MALTAAEELATKEIVAERAKEKQRVALVQAANDEIRPLKEQIAAIESKLASDMAAVK